MAAVAILEHSLVDVAQGQLADAAHALGRELELIALLGHVAGVFEQQDDLAQVLKVLTRLLAHQLL